MNFRRVVTALCLAAAAGATPLLVATPASATPAQCRSYLASEGYIVGTSVKYACDSGRSVGWSETNCTNRLINIGVRSVHAREACDRATWNG